MTAGQPDVSIVVVAYNARDLVLRCLSSVREHVELSHQAVVVDDASSDGTADAVREAHPWTQVLAQPRNQGLAAGRNRALPELRGRLVLMLDADTEVRPGAVEALAAVLDARPEVGLVGPKLVYPDGTLQLSARRWPPLRTPFIRRGPYARLNPDPAVQRRHMMADWDHATQRPVVYVIGAAQMWRADLPGLIGAYDSRISSYGGEDIDWCMRVWEAGLEVHYVPQAQVVHHFQKITRRKLYGRRSLRTLRDWYYFQWKHRSLRRDPRLARANA
jgi:N-acetylglucosaminyl-diphospho-decaprenol L-rhamnosyltransferase